MNVNGCCTGASQTARSMDAGGRQRPVRAVSRPCVTSPTYLQPGRACRSLRPVSDEFTSPAQNGSRELLLHYAKRPPPRAISGADWGGGADYYYSLISFPQITIKPWMLVLDARKTLIWHADFYFCAPSVLKKCHFIAPSAFTREGGTPPFQNSWIRPCMF